MKASVSEIEELVSRRYDFLLALDEKPSTKPELVERLETSRSTVDRGIDDLKAHDFVSRPDDRYQLTMAGKAVYERHKSYLGDLEAIDRANEVLSLLPPDIPFSNELLEDADIQVAKPHDPHQPLELATAIMSKATRLRKVSPAVLPICAEALNEREKGSLELEIVVSTDVLKTLTERYSEQTANLEEPGQRLYELSEMPPYALWIAETPDGKYTGLMPNSETGIQGLIVTENEKASRWALDQYETYRDRATPVETLCERA